MIRGKLEIAAKVLSTGLGIKRPLHAASWCWCCSQHAHTVDRRSAALHVAPPPTWSALTWASSCSQASTTKQEEDASMSLASSPCVQLIFQLLLFRTCSEVWCLSWSLPSASHLPLIHSSRVRSLVTFPEGIPSPLQPTCFSSL